MSPSTSTRWSPTPEQLMILEEMYKGGLRTPNASQIQKITAHLSFYGKIEGKNVFYWFQNHKARDRQKLRKKLSKQQQLLHDQLHLLHQYQIPQNYNASNILSLIDPPGHHHLLHDTPRHQGGSDGATARMTSNCTWKMNMDHHHHAAKNLQESENSMMRSPGDDWMMMMMMSMTRDVGPTSTLPCCSNNRPLKTLELFPIKAPNVKE